MLYAVHLCPLVCDTCYSNSCSNAWMLWLADQLYCSHMWRMPTQLHLLPMGLGISIVLLHGRRGLLLRWCNHFWLCHIFAPFILLTAVLYKTWDAISLLDNNAWLQLQHHPRQQKSPWTRTSKCWTRMLVTCELWTCSRPINGNY